MKDKGCKVCKVKKIISIGVVAFLMCCIVKALKKYKQPSE